MKNIEFSARSNVLPLDAVVLGFRGLERMSAPYAFEFVFRTTDTELDGLGAVGEPVTLEVSRPPASLLEFPQVWRIHGVVTSLEFGGDEGEHALYVLRFAPKLSLLSLSRHSRVFTDVTVPEVIAAVLKDEGVPASGIRFELETEYEKREHICQYGESSFAFVSRLMEREGIFYFFEQDGDEEVVVVTDDLAHYAPLSCGRVRYVPRGGDDASAADAFVSIAHERAALPGRVVMNDYDELHPSVDLRAEALVQEARPRIVEYGEHLLTPEQASRYTRIRAQALAATETRYFARGGVIGVHAGGTFQFETFGSYFPTDCLVQEVEHAGIRAGADPEVQALLGLDFVGGYRTDAVLLPADTQFRAAQTTPWPTIAGVEPAFVDGPADSIYAQIDDHGRYKVRLLFDEGDLVDGSRSTWVRMLEPHGGAPDGFHFPLRKGTEVHVAFLSSDPDRPMIVGVSPNAEKPSTVTAKNGTRNVLRTGSNNLWELEDLAGSQRVLLSTPSLATHLHLGAGGHQLELRTDGTGLLHYGADLDVSVGATKTETVASDLSETYRATHALSVTGPSTRTLQTSWNWTVLGPVTNSLSSTFDETIQGSVTETYSADLSTHAVGAVTLTDDGSLTETVSGGLAQERVTGGRTITVGATGSITVTGSAEETYGATTRTVHGNLAETVTGTFTVKAPKMLVYASDGTIVDQGISALESGVSWINAFVKDHYDDGTSVTGISLTAAGAQIKLAGYGKASTPLALSVAGALIDLAAVRVFLDGSYLQVKAVRMAMKALHLII
ncbi:MAG: type VI secretion system tip protein VgrG [Polyangiaceae bacterium]|nr:type VI secretion system tip protein VgrG [Polyangiaceae bacterium]